MWRLKIILSEALRWRSAHLILGTGGDPRLMFLSLAGSPTVATLFFNELRHLQHLILGRTHTSNSRKIVIILNKVNFPLFLLDPDFVLKLFLFAIEGQLLIIHAGPQAIKLSSVLFGPVVVFLHTFDLILYIGNVLISF